MGFCTDFLRSRKKKGKQQPTDMFPTKKQIRPLDMKAQIKGFELNRFCHYQGLFSLKN
jgi:hypothetical protein